MNFYYLVQQALPFVATILIVALGGMISERSGIINIALEGIMIIGAFAGSLIVLAFQTTEHTPTSTMQWILLLGMVVSAIAGALYSWLLSYSAIKFKSNQTIVGTALNIIAPAFVLFLSRMIWASSGVENGARFYIDKVPVLGDIPVLGPLLFQNTYLTVYISIIIFVAVYTFFYKTKTGLRMRACGEHPQAADSVGINVYKMRYIGTTLSGVLAGVGGFFYSVGIMSANINGVTGVAGAGFLALAVMIFGQWKPLFILFAAAFFGIIQILPYTIQLSEEQKGLRDFLNVLPYVATLLILAFTSKRSRAPKAEGIPYDKGQR